MIAGNDRLFEAGALDVIFQPAQMKKNRPGVIVQVLGRPDHRDSLTDILFQESSTLGVRFRYSLRKVLDRTGIELESPWGKIAVKKVTRPDGTSYVLPEYEACRKIARAHGLPLKDVYHWVTARNAGG